MLVVRGSQSAIAYGNDPAQFKYNHLGTLSQAGYCNQKTGEFIISSDEGLFVGTDPDYLELIPIPENVVRDIVFRESDGMYFAVTNQNNLIYYGRDLHGLNMLRLDTGIHYSRVRQSDGLFLATNTTFGILFWGYDPASLNRIVLAPEGIPFSVDIRDSDGMILVGGYDGKNWFGVNPESLTQKVIGNVRSHYLNAVRYKA